MKNFFLKPYFKLVCNYLSASYLGKGEAPSEPKVE